MSKKEDTAAAVVVPLLVIIAAVIIFIYFYYRKNKKFPWQKDRGTPYTAPVAHYHEIENIRSQKPPRYDYDYAEPEVVFTNLGGGNRNDEDYDHLGDKVTTSHGQYDTTASAAQEIKRSQSQETTTSPGQYQNLYDKGDSKVLHNAYDVVITPGQTPRSPDGNKGSSPGYSYLTAPQKQMVIRNEYDIANSQPSLSAEDVDSASGEKEKKNNKPNKPIPKKRLLTTKSKAPEGNGTYEMAKAPDANNVSLCKTNSDIPESNRNYELAKVPGANSESLRKTKSDPPEGNRSYELAKLPRATNVSFKTKSDTAGCNKRFDLAKIANSAYSFLKEKNKREPSSSKLPFKSHFSGTRNGVKSLKSDGVCDEITLVDGAIGQPGLKAKPSCHAIDGGYVVTRLVNQRPDDVIDETRMYDSPVTGGSVGNEHKAAQHYSLAGPCQSIYETPDTI